MVGVAARLYHPRNLITATAFCLILSGLVNATPGAMQNRTVGAQTRTADVKQWFGC